MKRSMDELTNQAIDLVLENNALHKRVLEPLKQKIMPYVIGFVLFNLMILILIIYILNLLSD
uniref:Uncharacterized protein n=1 Tax=viral metagenome TaxID=1070528 RepID=A0A6C0JYJ8_9ZZZZ